MVLNSGPFVTKGLKMPGDILTTASTIMCPHGGRAILITKNGRDFAAGAPVLLKTDVHSVVGCPFYRGDTYSPCVRIEWSAGANTVTVHEIPVLVKASIGKCFNPNGAPQGVATIINTQRKASAQ